MRIAALVVVLAWLVVTAWAWLRAPGKQAADQFAGIWRLPWGKQFFVDFLGLEVVLALWMLVHANEQGTMASAVVCIATMPLLGALSPALYWLLHGL